MAETTLPTNGDSAERSSATAEVNGPPFRS